MRVCAVVIAVIVALVTGAVPASAQGPDPMPIPETPPGGPVSVFLDDPAIVNAYPTRPQAWSRLPGDTGVRLYFTIGTPECYGVTATVSETPEQVIVDLRTGTRPAAVDRACIMIALSGGLDVPLNNPLGDRQVLSAT